MSETMFRVGTVTPDKQPEREVIRAAASDGRFVTMTVLRSERWMPNDVLVVEHWREGQQLP